jgi:hypothetical protein
MAFTEPLVSALRLPYPFSDNSPNNLGAFNPASREQFALGDGTSHRLHLVAFWECGWRFFECTPG